MSPAPLNMIKILFFLLIDLLNNLIFIKKKNRSELTIETSRHKHVMDV